MAKFLSGVFLLLKHSVSDLPPPNCKARDVACAQIGHMSDLPSVYSGKTLVKAHYEATAFQHHMSATYRNVTLGHTHTTLPSPRVALPSVFRKHLIKQFERSTFIFTGFTNQKFQKLYTTICISACSSTYIRGFKTNFITNIYNIIQKIQHTSQVQQFTTVTALEERFQLQPSSQPSHIHKFRGNILAAAKFTRLLCQIQKIHKHASPQPMC